MTTIKDSRITTIIFLQVACLVALVLGWVLIYSVLRPPTSASNQLAISLETSTPVSVAPMSTTIVTDSTPYPFDEEGILIINDKAVYLLYGANTRPDRVIQMVFVPQSICLNQQDKIIACSDKSELTSGSRVRISGNKNNGSVVVGMLTVLQ